MAALAAAALLAACGQTGALYLPDEGVTTPVEIRGPATTAPAPETPPPAPEEEEKDKKTESPPGP
jgi:predicted small lipoprotein YifL